MKYSEINKIQFFESDLGKEAFGIYSDSSYDFYKNGENIDICINKELVTTVSSIEDVIEFLTEE